MKRFVVVFAASVMAIAFSCSKHDPQPDCGCQGPNVLILKNIRAVHESAGLFTFTHPITLDKISAWACDVDSLWARSANNSIPDYTISGYLKKECVVGQTLMIVFPAIDITEIKKD